MADSSPALSLREGWPHVPPTLGPVATARSRSGSGPEEAELSLSLARTEPPRPSQHGQASERRAGLMECHLGTRSACTGDMLQDVSSSSGFTMEQIKRANKLFTNDRIFLRKTLNIPVVTKKPLLFNGLNSIDSPGKETADSSLSREEQPRWRRPTSSPQESSVQPKQPEEVSA